MEPDHSSPPHAMYTTKLLRPLAAIALPLFLAVSSLQEDDPTLSVMPDEGCVLSTHIAGTWEEDLEVTKHLGAKPDKRSLTIELDLSVLDRLNKGMGRELRTVLASIPIRAAGTVVWRKDGKVIVSSPFLLADIKGNTHLVVFRDRDGKLFGDTESALLSFALGKERANDLLFQGGDSPNGPYHALRRVTQTD